MKKFSYITLLAMFLLSACSTKRPQSAESEMQPVSTLTVVEAPMPKQAAAEIDQDSELSILGHPWADAENYRAGLIAAQRAVLEEIDNFNEYHISIEIAENLSSLIGKMALRYVNNEDQPMDELRFHLYTNVLGGRMEITAAAVNETPVDWQYDEYDTVARVELPQAVQPGETIFLSMAFVNTIPTEMGGNYGLYGYFEDVLVLDTFYPTLAVYDEKGWHARVPYPVGDLTFADASFYLVEVTAPAELVMAASGITLESAVRLGRQSSLYAIGPARDFYVAGSRKFDISSQQLGEVRINSYAFPEHAAATKKVLDYSEKALRIFSERYGDYPYTEFDVLSTPMKALGIEYPGIVGIALRIYDIETDPSLGVYLESVVVPEVGHQWFHNFVGSDQGLQPWLDEAVTQYVTGVYYEDRYGAQSADVYRERAWYDRWGRVDHAETPIGMETIAYYENKDYSPIVYGRGPYFLMTLKEVMGEADFDRFMRAYVDQYQWEIADAVDFETLAEAVCNCELSGLFSEWVYGY